jgi:hypothetical protein
VSAVRAGLLFIIGIALLAGCDRGSSGSAASSPCDAFDARTDVGGSGEVDGRATYGKPVIASAGPAAGFVLTPIRHAAVEVMSCETGAALASGTTDGDGRFLVSFLNNGRVGVYVRVLASSARYAVSVRRSAAEPFGYGLVSAVYDDAGDGETIAVSGMDTAGNLGAGVFNIFDQGLRGAELVESLTGSPPTAPLVWYWYPGNPGGTAYSPTNRAIAVLGTSDDADEFDDAVLLHEYGHYVLDVYSRDDSPGGPHVLGDSSLDLRLAWSEGWATFFSSAVRSDPQHADTGGGAVRLAFNIETPPSFGDGTRYDSNELAVAAVLWDAYDASDTDEGAGPLSVSLASLWSLARGLTDAPVTFEDFWAAWQAANPGNLQPILAGLQIDLWEDAQEAGANDNDPARATPIALYAGDTGAIQHHTLYPAGDVDYVVFTAPASGAYTVATSRCTLLGAVCVARVSNAADTVLDVAGVTPPATADNLNGQTYQDCASTACPPNDASTLSSKVTFSAAAGVPYVVRISRAPSAPPSAAETGSYDIVVTDGG